MEIINYEDILQLVITEQKLVESEIDKSYDIGYRQHAREERLFLQQLLKLLDFKFGMLEIKCRSIEKRLKALEIIRTVCPNVFWVMRTRTFKEYKKKCDDDTLLEEQYNLLREVLL